MARSNLWSRCTAQRSSGSFCDADSLPAAPFPICVHHAAELVRYVTKVVETATDGNPPETSLDLFRRFNVIIGTMSDRVEYPRPTGQPQVYYLSMDGLIKIGYSTNLKNRLAHYPPMAKLLAVEPGGPEIEQMRHKQFAHLRKFGPKCEWFADAPELREHIGSLKPA